MLEDNLLERAQLDHGSVFAWVAGHPLDRHFVDDDLVVLLQGWGTPVELIAPVERKPGPLLCGRSEQAPIATEARDLITIGVGDRCSASIKQELILVDAVRQAQCIDIPFPPSGEIGAFFQSLHRPGRRVELVPICQRRVTGRDATGIWSGNPEQAVTAGRLRGSYHFSSPLKKNPVLDWSRTTGRAAAGRSKFW